MIQLCLLTMLKAFAVKILPKVPIGRAFRVSLLPCMWLRVSGLGNLELICICRQSNITYTIHLFVCDVNWYDTFNEMFLLM